MLLISVGTHAQFNKGRMLVGGQLSFNYTPDPDYKGSAFSLNPQFGYFVINNFAVGAGLNYSLQKFNYNNSGDYLTTSLQIQPFVRYYFKPGIFIHGSYGIGAGKVSETNTTDYNYSFNLYSWTGSAGYAIFLNDNVAIEPMLGYKWNTFNQKDSDSKSSSSSLYFQVGLQVYLGRRD